MRKTEMLVVGLVLAFTPFQTWSAWGQNRSRPKAGERRKSAQAAKARDVARLLTRFDTNHDDALEATELPKALQDFLASLDTDKNGKFDQAELMKMRGRPGRKGEIITGAAKGERYDDTLEVGDAAPEFTLADPTGKRQVTLSSFQAERPVVLIFGSYT